MQWSKQKNPCSLRSGQKLQMNITKELFSLSSVKITTTKSERRTTNDWKLSRKFIIYPTHVYSQVGTQVDIASYMIFTFLSPWVPWGVPNPPGEENPPGPWSW